jgi:lysozyme
MANLLKVPIIPKLDKEEALKIIADHGITEKVVVLGIRGYVDGSNERGIYDDALFIVSPGYFNAYNANTDPSVIRKGAAVLVPGVYRYKKGLHGISGPHPYIALRQAGRVAVLRDGSTEPVTDTAAAPFWIDIHKGGYTTTSSLGCQTIHPDQWPNFRDNVFREMDRYNQDGIFYCLIEKNG